MNQFLALVLCFLFTQAPSLIAGEIKFSNEVISEEGFDPDEIRRKLFESVDVHSLNLYLIKKNTWPSDNQSLVIEKQAYCANFTTEELVGIISQIKMDRSNNGIRPIGLYFSKGEDFWHVIVKYDEKTKVIAMVLPPELKR